MGALVSFKRPDGGVCKGYLVGPANAPGLVVIHQWWGLNDQIKTIAKQLATAGYRVLAPDLFRGLVATEIKEAEHLMQGLNFRETASQDIRGAVRYLKATGSIKVGVMGSCMGGPLAALAAMFVPESSANVAWYGYAPLDYVPYSKIKAPLQDRFGNRGQIADSGVDAIEATLKGATSYDAKHTLQAGGGNARDIDARL